MHFAYPVVFEPLAGEYVLCIHVYTVYKLLHMHMVWSNAVIVSDIYRCARAETHIHMET